MICHFKDMPQYVVHVLIFLSNIGDVDSCNFAYIYSDFDGGIIRVAFTFLMPMYYIPVIFILNGICHV